MHAAGAVHTRMGQWANYNGPRHNTNTAAATLRTIMISMACAVMCAVCAACAQSAQPGPPLHATAAAVLIIKRTGVRIWPALLALRVTPAGANGLACVSATAHALTACRCATPMANMLPIIRRGATLCQSHNMPHNNVHVHRKH